MTNVSTTIQPDKKVMDRLRELKIHPRESYSKVIKRLLTLGTDNGELCEETIRDVKKSLKDVKAGRTISMEEVKRRLNARASGSYSV
jgi:predicted CopG family antitoxin